MRVQPYPPEFFQPPKVRPETWPDEPDVRCAVEWFKTFVPEVEWQQRREAACDRLYAAATGELEDPSGRGAFFDSGDRFGWYLFLAEAFIDHAHNYEPMYGSRVVPVMQAIGRKLDLLKSVAGVQARAERLVGSERGQANAGLFELVVAAAYREQGFEVAFVPETQGGPRSHDMDVTRGPLSYAVECKRMETGDYGEAERQRIRDLWGPCSAGLVEMGRSAICKVALHVPVECVPKHYFLRHAARWVKSGENNLIWYDEIGHGGIGELDLRPLQAVLEADEVVLAAGTRMQELLSGEYIRNGNFVQVMHLEPGDNPRYVSACDQAVVLRWETLSPISIDNKARDVFRKLKDATDQLPKDRPGIVHIGFEAVEGDAVEAMRHAKIIETVRRFDPRGKPLEYVYAHYFVPESPPDQAWAFDETCQWIGVRNTGPKPLDPGFLLVPPDESGRGGPHWKFG